MYARIAAFENRDTPRLDELVRRLLAGEGADQEVPAALGLYLLIDRAEGRALGLSLFESKEALEAAQPVLERMGNELMKQIHGRRVSIDVYETIFHEVVEGATAARITTLKGDAPEFDREVRRTVEELLPALRTREGWRGVMVLVDRAAAVAKTITLWESTEALQASELYASEQRRRATDWGGELILSVTRFDVVFSSDRAPRLVAL